VHRVVGVEVLHRLDDVLDGVGLDQQQTVGVDADLLGPDRVILLLGVVVDGFSTIRKGFADPLQLALEPVRDLVVTE
jgi:hypothetical protein